MQCAANSTNPLLIVLPLHVNVLVQVVCPAGPLQGFGYGVPSGLLQPAAGGHLHAKFN
jgi:hypothetical protein